MPKVSSGSSFEEVGVLNRLPHRRTRAREGHQSQNSDDQRRNPARQSSLVPAPTSLCLNRGLATIAARRRSSPG